MKIWYQAYDVSARADPAWRYFEEACERYVPKVARPDTEIHFSWVERRTGNILKAPYDELSKPRAADCHRNPLRRSRPPSN